MARDMMNIDVFRKSLEKSDATLKPFGVELIKMIEESTDETFSSPLNSFVCIVSIQVRNSFHHSIVCKICDVKWLS